MYCPSLTHIPLLTIIFFYYVKKITHSNCEWYRLVKQPIGVCPIIQLGT